MLSAQAAVGHVPASAFQHLDLCPPETHMVQHSQANVGPLNFTELTDEPMGQPNSARSVAEEVVDLTDGPTTPPKRASIKVTQSSMKVSVVARLRDAGIDHNIAFQKAHEEANVFVEKGHWGIFTRAVTWVCFIFSFLF